MFGGDTAAEAKVEGLLAALARVTVVAPALTPGLAALRDAGRIAHEARAYRDGDLHGVMLAYAVERDARIIASLRAEADRERTLLNVVDVPDACTFYAGAVVARGDLQVAIGTGGESPGAAARLRRELDTLVGPEYGPYVAILGAVRRLVAGGRRAEVMGHLIDSDLLRLVRGREQGAIDALLQRIAGEGCTLGRLGVGLGGEG